MAEHRGLVVCSCNGLATIRCEACGYVHVWPLPTQDELDVVYDDFYANAPHLLEQQPSQGWYWWRVYRERLRTFRELIPVALHKHLLDWGAGTGEFLRVAALGGRWFAVGYEPNPVARRLTRVVDGPLVFGSLGATDGWSKTYHAVHCSLVLEHVLDPAAVLGDIFDRLVPGGVLCLVVPSEFNRLQRRLAERSGYCPLHPAHVNYFTPQSLAALASCAGFGEFQLEATFPMEWWALHGLDYVRRPRLGRVAHFLRMAFEVALMETWPSVLRRLRHGWAGKGVGREIVLWARRPA